ncbi:MAG: DNA-processing protein DprA [Oscillospiraceae bacterium]
MEKLYYIWLSLVFPNGSDKPNEIVMRFPSVEEFYNLSKDEMFKLPFLTAKDIISIKATSLERAKLVLKDCQDMGIEVVTYQDEEYPQRLKLIYGPPVVFYVKGNISGINDEVLITCVGTRKYVDYTAYATEFLCCQLAKAGVIVVSGCAVGIDTFAHKGALRAGKKTFAVMGCGLDIDYPSENRELKQLILDNGGALISELPPRTPVIGKYFPVRNRILAGISLGVLLTHAPEKSGSLITAEYAIEQGKDVFCLPPYSIFDARFMGVVKYLRDGAVPVFSAKDILFEYCANYANKLDIDMILGSFIDNKKSHSKSKEIKENNNQQTIEEKPNVDLDGEYKVVYDVLKDNPRFIDEVSVDCGYDVGKTLSILAELEIMGIVKSYSGRRYSY